MRAEVAIIGAGFGGIAMAVALERAGCTDYVILEKAADVGGVWRDNVYPGAACDVPSHLYSLSFAPHAGWSRRFAAQPEILAYAQACVARFGLRARLRLGVEVTAAAFDEAACEWVLTTTTGGLRARTVVAAVGQLGRPVVPALVGLERFRGPSVHSARWDPRIPLDGARLAVIGTGASAIQLVPAVAARVAHLYLFQRSAPYVIPKRDPRYGRVARALYANVPGLLAADRARLYGGHEARAIAMFEAPSMLRLYQRLFQRHLARQVPDAALRKRLTPDYPLGCKRILQSNDYYPALQLPHVELVTTGIREITEGSIVASDGARREVDAIVFATGFASTDFLAPIEVRGRGGHLLREVWGGRPEAYLGIAVSGFPNLFMLYGPNTNLSHNSILVMLEAQAGYIAQAVSALRTRRTLEVRAAVQRAFNADLQAHLGRSIWAAGCTSWYQTADGTITNNWPGFTLRYRQRTRRLELADYLEG